MRYLEAYQLRVYLFLGDEKEDGEKGKKLVFSLLSMNIIPGLYFNVSTGFNLWFSKQIKLSRTTSFN